MQDGKSITTRIAVPLETVRGRPTRERRERSGALALGYLSHGGEADGESTKKVDEWKRAMALRTIDCRLFTWGVADRYRIAARHQRHLRGLLVTGLSKEPDLHKCDSGDSLSPSDKQQWGRGTGSEVLQDSQAIP